MPAKPTSTVQTGASERMSRRSFVARTLTLGVSLTSMGTLLQACATSAPSTDASSSPSALHASTDPRAGRTVTVRMAVVLPPDDLPRWEAYVADFEERYDHIDLELHNYPGAGYEAKLLTEINAGAAPDNLAMYEDLLPNFIKNGALAPLDDLVAAPDSPWKLDDLANPRLIEAYRWEDGKLYALPTQCNPLVIWYNRDVLAEAGIADMPADLYEQGRWTRDAFVSMAQQVQAQGKQGYVYGAWWAHPFSWITANGGAIYQDDRFVLHEDPRSVEAIRWLAEQLRAKTFTYAGALPEGQGEVSLFLASQTAFVGGGRYFLPAFAGKGVGYDIVPWPSNTGEQLVPTAVAVGIHGINRQTGQLPEVYLTLADLASAHGQRFFLTENGFALPVVKGIDDLVTQTNDPPHARYFLDARDAGYGFPPPQARVPGLTDVILQGLEPIWLGNADVETTLAELGAEINQQLAAAGAGS
jgi:multiple sugar transport system substrate-binding protein